MITTEKLTPEIYYKRSRDFQVLGRIYDIIFNYIKNNADLIDNAPLSDNFDTKLLDLLSTTLGFKESHTYNVSELKALCSIFTTALRNKGNIQSIQLVLDMLANISNSNSRCYVNLDESEPYKISVYIPENVYGKTLFEDVLNYILPAGIICDVKNQESIQAINEVIIPFDSHSIEVEAVNPMQTESSMVHEKVDIPNTDPLSKYFGRMTTSTVMRVYSDPARSSEGDERAKLSEIKQDYLLDKSEEGNE